MSILVFGSMNIDRTFYLPHFLLPGETLQSKELTVHAGGKGANQAVALAKAGVQVLMAGTIGNDGIWIKGLLESYGVDISLIQDKENIQTGTADILVDDNGNNGIVLYGGGNQANDTQYIDQVFSKCNRGDWVVFENETNNLPYLFAKAAEHQLKICFNASPMEESLLNLPLDTINLLVVNEIEGTALAGKKGSHKEILGHLVKNFPATEILLTIGKEGSLYAYHDIRLACPIVEATVRDTTAAGDTFLGYFLAMRANGFDVKKSMIEATKASAITVSRLGSMDSIPFRRELEIVFGK